MIFEVLECEKSIKNLSKIDQKMESKMDCILASIFERFWWILGGKLGSKIEQKSIPKGIERVMKKEGHQDSQKVAIRNTNWSGVAGSIPLGRRWVEG